MIAAWPSSFEAFLDYQIGGFYAWRAGAALLVVLAGIALRSFLFARAISPIERLLERTKTEVDDYIVEKTKTPFAWLLHVLTLYLGALILKLPSSTTETIGVVASSAATLLTAWLVFRLIDVGVHVLDEYTRETEATIDDQLVPVVRRISRLILFVVAILVVVQQWGYDVSTLIAGLGIGGLAFALAARNMLSNWFGALMIFTDRPFEVGEWVETDYGQGEVEEVGLRSTRIRTYGRERIVVPNGEIASKPVTNHAAVDRRQMQETIGLVYGTTHEQLTQVLDGIRSLLDEHDAVWDGDWRVFFVGFGDSALEIELSCFTTDPDWAFFRETREEIFLEITRIVEEAGTEFAFPTRSIHFEDAPPAPPVRPGS